MKEKNRLLTLVKAMHEDQKKKLLQTGRDFVPHLTEEDVLQPNDFRELEENPHFRYEEGILAGIQMVEMALRAELLSELSG